MIIMVIVIIMVVRCNYFFNVVFSFMLKGNFIILWKISFSEKQILTYEIRPNSLEKSIISDLSINLIHPFPVFRYPQSPTGYHRGQPLVMRGLDLQQDHLGFSVDKPLETYYHHTST